MRVNSSASTSSVEPRMSICLKNTTNLLEEHELSSTSFDDILHPGYRTDSSHDRLSVGSSGHSRLPLSTSSILLTGTPYSILSTSTEPQEQAQVIERKLKKDLRKGNRVRFSETLHLRNHLHVKDIKKNEKTSAWFGKTEYRAIFKNNTKIIQCLGKKEKELKKTISREKRVRMRRKKRDPCEMIIKGADDEEFDYEEYADLMVAIKTDEEQGFSTRGLENESKKKRKHRDHNFLKAKYVVLSLQAEVDDHMDAMQEEFGEKLARIAKRNSKNKASFKKNTSYRSSNSRWLISLDEHEGESDNVREKIATTKQEFATYARKQYNEMICRIADRYGDISKHDAKDALERGRRDEKTARAIEWMDAQECCNIDIISNGSSGKGSDEDKRKRPSSASTARTDESSSISSLSHMSASRRSSLGSVKMGDGPGNGGLQPNWTRVNRRAKKFLRSFLA
mmetsp:Transcript_22184/g.46677  ORF Transcript_22184/g.46677 Transcript_22184/m.46677 type:complete len:452 (+) Transcript_22184:387-1742(+)|eukprot:CAMPEP_0201123828 /NCGR_PEP_ID=MMETSP0850-20130426/9109_1 /ASSEMBLY_ACC=CAM_ASM_000622 /TAXON_ID=183588 /ORGANISM="Pseudo-nitzschia fraudulenta, Strain WWA7" /LENGTH=451 /DNA_ID=CAMNT_0047390913 /DNA_START=302 /DNA_END=1657 /DNA_ORIENTATION=+